MIENLREQFYNIEKERFVLVDKYIKGIINIDEVNKFGKTLEEFKKVLYNIEIEEAIVLEIAKMKSMIQHYYTEIMEDEELLNIAYSNKF